MATTANSLFNDQVIATIRGRAEHTASQLLQAQAEASGERDPEEFAAALCTELAAELLAVDAFLLHCHALTIEAQTAREALDKLRSERPDITLLDLGLPDRDGLELVPIIKKESDTTLIIVSARDATDEKVAALGAHAQIDRVVDDVVDALSQLAGGAK